MRKSITIVLGLALVAGAFAAPALAGKTTKGTFTAVNAPLPVTGDVEDDFCFNKGVEGVHKTTVPVKAAATGKLTVVLDGFEGDWDLYVTDAKTGSILGSSTGDQTSAMAGLGGDPADEKVQIPVIGKKTLNITACNWAGSPTATATWKYVVR
jgi:hypothetical protein